MAFEIKDIGGLGSIGEKLLDIISQGVGRLTKSYFQKKDAKTKAYEIRVLAEAIRSEQNTIQQITVSNNEFTLLSKEGQPITEAIDIEVRTNNRVSYQEALAQQNIESIV